MHRNERTPISRLLGAIHARRTVPELSRSWRTGVMSEIARSDRSVSLGMELQRFAPRFAMTAVAISVVLAFTASWTVYGLSNELLLTYERQMFEMVPMTLLSM